MTILFNIAFGRSDIDFGLKGGKLHFNKITWDNAARSYGFALQVGQGGW